MQLKHYSLMLLTLLVVSFTACQEDEYSLPEAKPGLTTIVSNAPWAPTWWV